MMNDVRNKQNIDLLIEDTRIKIIDIINNSGLPISIINYIISDIHSNVRIAKQNTLERLAMEDSKNSNKN